MDEDRDDRALIAAVGAVVPVVVASLLVTVRDEVLNANLALILMGVVVLAAILGGRTAGALAAVTAALSFDFFLTEPYLTLRITDHDDVETTIILFVVGVAVGQFADLARKSRRASRTTRTELDRLRRVADLVSQGGGRDDVTLAGQNELTALLRLLACSYESEPFDRVLPRLERSGVLDHATTDDTVVRRYVRGGFELPTDGVELPVFHRGTQVGRYVLVPSPGVGVTLEQRVVALALADQVGAALGE